MDTDTHFQILKEYDEKVALYTAFTEKTRHLIDEILKENSTVVHSVSARVKSRQSVEKKLNKQDSNYSQLSDITDIAGVRVITYFSDEVDQITTLLEQEFSIDKINSVDKRQTLNPDRFGYLSMHLVASLLDHRSKLIEYKRFPNLKIEIQTRSILQHAWAEIEHDLGYKTQLGIPKNVRRKFSRLAGLLELADEEFLSIRKELQRYEKEVSIKIDKIPESVALDRTSLVSFVAKNQTVKELDKKIASFTGGILKPSDPTWIERYLPGLQFFDITTIASLQSKLEENAKFILPFATKWLENDHTKSWYPGITLFYLSYVILGKIYSVNEILNFLNFSKIGTNDERSTVASRVKDVFSMVAGSIE